MRNTLATLILASCGPSTEPLDTAHWGVAGCVDIIQGARCEVRELPATLTIWVDGSPAHIEVTSNQEHLDTKTTEGLTGVTAQAEVTTPGTHIQVTVSGDARQVGNMEVVLVEQASWPPDTTMEALEASLPDLDELNRARALSILARRQLSSRGRDVSRWLDDAVRLYLKHGRTTLAYRDASMAAWLASDAGDLRDHATRVASLPTPILDLPHMARLQNDQLLARLHTHDARGALTHAEAADRWARRASDLRTEGLVSSHRAEVLETLGRHQEALQLRAAGLHDVQGCNRAWALNSYGWSLILASEAGVRPQDLASWPFQGDIEAVHIASVALARESDCHRPDLFAANAAINRALGALHLGDLDRARAALDEVAAFEEPMSDEMEAWRQLAAGRLALGTGDAARAMTLSSGLAQWTEASGAWDVAVRALHLRALSLEAAGQLSEAAATLAAAQRTVAAHGRLMPTWLGKDGFLVAWHKLALDHARMLVANGEPVAAVTMWRRYRAGFLESLGVLSDRANVKSESRQSIEAALLTYEAASAQLAVAQRNARRGPMDQRAAAQANALALKEKIHQVLDEVNALAPPAGLAALRSPAPGERLVGWIPIPSEPLGFVVDGDSVHVVPVQPWQDKSGDALADAIFRPLLPWLRGATQLTLMPVGSLQTHDLHALKIDDTPLSDIAAVTYGLDLPARHPRKFRDEVVVVADPTSDLEAARHEATAVVSILQQAAVPVTVLTGDEASLSAVRDAISTAPALLHYAGHGTWSEEDLDGGLLLAGSTRLSLADLLTLPSAPKIAILNGCETAKTKMGPLASLGLAQGLLTSGTQAVFAADRAVDDRLASHLAEALYRGEIVTKGPIHAWKHATRTLRNTYPNEDWAAFRLLVR